MKLKLTLILLFLFGMTVGKSFAAIIEDIPEQVEVSDIPPNSTEIVLIGDLNCMGPNSVEAYLSKHAVVVNFNQNLGFVSILLIGGAGNMVYSGTVNTAVQQIVYIPIEGAPDGSYIITLENYASMAEGEFEK